MARYYSHAHPAPEHLETIPCPVCGHAESSFVADDNGFSIRKCVTADCGFVYVNPRPDPKWLESFYAQFYPPDEAVPERWELEMGGIFKECREVLCAHIRTGEVLDVGCSFGHFLMDMERRGFRTTGIEPSPVAAEYAQRHLSGKVYTAPFESVELPDASFDAIVSLYVLEHVSAPREFMEKVYGLLRPSGMAIIRIPYTEPLFPIQRLMRRSYMYAPMHLNDFSPRAFERLALGIGFSSVQVRVGKRRRAHDLVENAGALLLGGVGRAMEIATAGRAVFPWVGALSYYVYK